MRHFYSLAVLIMMAGFCFGQDTIPVFRTGEIHVKTKAEYPFAICKYDTVTWPYIYSTIPGFDSIAQVSGIYKIEKTFKLLGPSSDRLRNIYSIYFDVDSLSEELLTFMDSSGQVEYSTKVPIFRLSNTPDDPLYNTTDQWNLAKIMAADAWNLTIGKNDVKIAIVDDAVLLNHDDLKYKIWLNQGELPTTIFNNSTYMADGIIDVSELMAFYSITSGNINDLIDPPSPLSPPLFNNYDDDGNLYKDDVFGWDATMAGDNNPNPPSGVVSNSFFTHGTHVAGIAGAQTTSSGSNGTGIASVGWNCSLIPVKCKEDNSTDTLELENCYEGVEYAIAAGADVINMSFGSSVYVPDFADLILEAYQKGIICVAAVGNDNVSTLHYPAAYDHVLAVGASDENDEKAFFSNYSGATKWVDVMAPGINILSTLAGGTNSYGDLHGTSMASPLVAGLSGLMKSYCPTCTPDEIMNCIKNTCDSMPDENMWDEDSTISLVGHGRINAFNAIACITYDPVAYFSPGFENICPGASVPFFDASIGYITSWNWSSSDTSIIIDSINGQNPIISFPNTPNLVYTITLIVSNDTITGTGASDTISITDTLITPSASITFPSVIQDVCNTNSYGYFVVSFSGGYPPYEIGYEDNFGNPYTMSNIMDNPYIINVDPFADTTTAYTLTSFTSALGCTGTYSGSATYESKPCDCEPKRNNHWIFGGYYGIQFQPTINDNTYNEYIVPYTNNLPPNYYPPPVCFEATATISDSYGDLLFFTNGTDVYKRNFEHMGTINGYFSSAQGAIILPKSISDSTYYIFTTGAQNWSGFWYHIVDLDAATNGSLVLTNVDLQPAGVEMAEMLTWVEHGNSNGSYWVITHGNLGHTFYVYLATPNGIGLVNSIQINSGNSIQHGLILSMIKSNQEGNLLAATFNDETYNNPIMSGPSFIELYNFDNMSGNITFLDSSFAIQHCYGVEFSPNSNYLYVNNGDDAGSNPGKLFRFNISGLTPTLDSLQLLMSGSLLMKGMQLAPNKQEILISNFLSPYISSIQSPDAQNYTNIDFIPNRYTGDTLNATYGLPQLVPNEPLSINATAIAHDCNNNCGGVAWVDINNSIQPVTIQWNDPNLQTNDTAFNLCPGTYQVVVTDANSCPTIDTVIINGNELVISNLVIDKPCFGQSDGGIDITVNSNFYPLSFFWSNGETTEDIVGIPAGWYSVTVTDANGCTDSISTTVTENPEIEISFLTRPSCGKHTDGHIVALVTGGTSPYSYFWSNSQTTDSIGSLTAGTYLLTVFDMSGCNDTASVYLSYHDTSSISATIQAPTCYGYSDGAIDLTVTPYPPYTYVWSNGATTEDIENLSSDIYFVDVYDSIGCLSSDTFDVYDGLLLNCPVSSSYNPTCNCNASAFTMCSAGYYTEWSNGETTNFIDTLCAGIYYITITDSITTCSIVDSVIIEYDTTLLWSNFEHSNPTCQFISDGELLLNVGGSYEFYYVEWIPLGITDTVVCTSNGTYFEGSTPLYTGLSHGWYFVTVTNDVGCLYTDSIYLEPEYELDFSVDINPYCSSYSPGSASVSVITGAAPYTYNWSTNETTSFVDSLGIGSYSVTLTDANGCSDVDTFAIDYTFHFDVSVVDENCYNSNNGEISVDIIDPQSPNYSYFLFLNGAYIPYCYLCDTIHTFSNVEPNDYYWVQVRVNGCISVDSFIQVLEADTFFLDYDITANNCAVSNDYTIDLNVTGAYPPFNYSWSNGGSTNPLNVTTPGEYLVTVTDINGCFITSNIAIDSVVQVEIETSNPSCPEINDGYAIASVLYGQPPYSYLWTTGETTDSIGSLGLGNYFITVSDQYGCNIEDVAILTDEDFIALNTIAEPPTCADANGDSLPGYIELDIINGHAPFNYNWSTGDTVSTIDSLATGIYFVTVGDAVGCFLYDTINISSPSLRINFDERGNGCDSTANGRLSIISIDGGQSPYSYSWDNSTTIDSIYDLVDYAYHTVTVSDANGCVGIDSSFTFSEQEISLPAGWSIWSTYIDNLGDVRDFFENNGMDSLIIIMKNGLGNIYWPAYVLNTIGDFDFSHGYQINMQAACSFTAEGMLVCPEDNPINLTTGWGIYGYLRKTPMSMVDAFSPVVDSLDIVKSGNGLVYWPLYGVNAIGNIKPGQGYHVKMFNSEYLTYPANISDMGTKSSNTLGNSPQVYPNDSSIRTDQFMIVGIPLMSWSIPPQYGDEIQVHGENGQLVGISAFFGGFTAVVIYGDDTTTPNILEGLADDENFTISSVAQGSKALRNLKVESWQRGTGQFEYEMVSVVGNKSNLNEGGNTSGILSLDLYPNPGTGMFYLEIYTSNACNAHIEVFNIDGKLVLNENNIELSDGWQRIILNLTHLPSGTYTLRVISEQSVAYKKLLIIK